MSPCEKIVAALVAKGVDASMGERWDTGPSLWHTAPDYHTRRFWYFHPSGESIGVHAEYPSHGVRAYDAGFIDGGVADIVARIEQLPMGPTREAIWEAIEPQRELLEEALGLKAEGTEG